MKLPKIGLRILKTALAVLITMLISDLLLSNLANDRSNFDSSIAVIVAIFTIQDTTKNTIKYAVERISGTLLGSVLGIGILAIILATKDHFGGPYALWTQFVFYGLAALGTIASIYFCKVIKRPQMAALAAFILVCVIYEYTHPNPYLATVARVTETLIGILVALVVNRFIAPLKVPCYKDSCPQNVDNLSTIVDKLSDKTVSSNLIQPVEKEPINIQVMPDGITIIPEIIEVQDKKSTNEQELDYIRLQFVDDGR